MDADQLQEHMALLCEKAEQIERYARMLARGEDCYTVEGFERLANEGIEGLSKLD